MSLSSVWLTWGFKYFYYRKPVRSL